MRFTVFAILALVIASLPGGAIGETVRSQEERTAVWAPLERLVGTWKGQNDGIFGAAELEVTWKFVLGGKFLQSTTKSVSDDETREDIGMLSYDRKRKRFILREFYSEGHVNQFVLTVSDDMQTLEFETEAIENGFTPDLHCKSTLTFVSTDKLTGSLALATGGRPYDTCVSTSLTRSE